MPLYPFECGACGGREDLILRVSERDDPQECECGGEMARAVSKPHLHGIIFSNARTVQGMTIERQEDWNAFVKQQEADGFKVGGAEDKKAQIDRVREKVDKTARKRGFRDHEDWKKRKKEYFRDRKVD